MFGSRADWALIALFIAIMLFAVFATVSQLSMLSGYSYALDYGWNPSKKVASVSTLPAVCSVQSSERGFPILYERQANKAPSDSSGACQITENPLAKRMDMALCFAAAAIIGAGAASAVRSRQ